MKSVYFIQVYLTIFINAVNIFKVELWKTS